MKQLLKNLRTSFFIRQTSPVLLYHHLVANQQSLGTGAKLHAVRIEQFEEQVRALQRRFEFIWVDELLQRSRAGKKTAGLAALTFDDAYLSVFELGLPVLEKLGVPATVFVNASLAHGKPFWRDAVRWIIDNQRQAEFLASTGGMFKNISISNFYEDSKNASLARPQAMAEAVIRFYSNTNVGGGIPSVYASTATLKSIQSPFIRWGNHSANHLVMAGLTQQEQHDEIAETDIFLRNNFPSEKISSVFAVPFGSKGTYNSDTFAALKRLHYTGLLYSQTGEYLRFGKRPYYTFEGMLAYNRFLPKENTIFY